MSVGKKDAYERDAKIMIRITGDIHTHIGRLLKIIDESSHGDVIIQLGDAGLNLMNYYNQYPGQDEENKSTLNSAAEWKGVKLLFVYGNHEKRPSTIDSYRLIDFCDAQAYVEDKYPALVFLKDGDIYTIAGKICLILGGAYSTDKDKRLEGRDWWADEQPSQEIRDLAEKNIKKFGYKVDYVISHTCPKKYIPQNTTKAKILEERDEYITEEWLDELEEKLDDYRGWYCGHWHINETAPENPRIHFLYNDIEVLQ